MKLEGIKILKDIENLVKEDIKNDPTNKDHYNLLIRMQVAMGDYQEVIKSLDYTMNNVVFDSRDILFIKCMILE